jgi:hypothetical protein
MTAIEDMATDAYDLAESLHSAWYQADRIDTLLAGRPTVLTADDRLLISGALRHIREEITAAQQSLGELEDMMRGTEGA